jgi:hypothetical protein
MTYLLESLDEIYDILPTGTLKHRVLTATYVIHLDRPQKPSRCVMEHEYGTHEFEISATSII